jgi:carbon-monoxide dehydrogenase small subunit
MAKVPITIEVNGESHEALIKSSITLLDFLRDHLFLTGTKKGCDTGECGACTVILDGRVVNSCLVLAVDANGSKVTTIEGLGGATHPHPLQKAFAEHGAIQCGYCTPGIIISAKALLDRNPNPNEGEIKTSLAGHLCRCGGYLKIIEAVKAVVGSKDR